MPHRQSGQAPVEEDARQDAEQDARPAGHQGRLSNDAAQKEESGRRSMFVRRLLVDVAVGVENRYRRPLVGGGVHLAFLKMGRFFIGAPGVMVASAPEWVEVSTLNADPDPQAPRRATRFVLQRRVTPLLTQSFSWQLLARPYGYVYLTLVATKRVPVTDSRWDPAVAVSFTPR